MSTQKIKKVLQGKVIGTQRDKTITVLIERPYQHPRFKKIVMRSKKYHVDDPKNQAKDGDMVEITACRPISKTKTWRLLQIIKSVTQ